ncbi:S8 family serine peptidase [Roseofilum sp. BLCC_M91]|uniref:S8 family serine peptidase n=1 Tax=Roseofilum halophilum BLCC-M91 TaxID=3022259 RepID=A0ABT7BM03_9CYAN|nr:DUF4114 domain-containing protein [Roseofilum halophilum]MDJ1180223.1 S8 family serine peptidase [Roseofilum halophilum BLCC-M91]
MSFLNWFGKKSPKTEKNQDSQTFILEPILTPSGIVDSLEETPESLDVDTVDLPELDADLVEEADTGETQEAEPDTSEEIETAEVTNLIPDEDIEEIEFITDSPTEEGTEPSEVIETESETDSTPEQVVAQAATLHESSETEEIDFASETQDTTSEDETEVDETLENSDEHEPTQVIEQLTQAKPDFEFDSGVFTVGETGEVEIEYLFDGGKYQGEVAFFSLEGMDNLEPGSEAFIQEAAARALGIEPTETPSDVGAGSTTILSTHPNLPEPALTPTETPSDVGAGLSTDSLVDPDLGEPAPTDTDFPAENAPQFGEIVISDKTEGAKFEGAMGEKNWNKGEFAGVKTVQMRPGDTFGVMLVPNKSVQQVFDNPSIGGSGRPLFSLATANPDDGLHIGQIADVTGDGHTFVMEDIRVDGKSDYDYNDIIFRIKGATGQAVNLDEVIDAENDWRETELGQEILDYIKPEPLEVISEIESVVIDPEEPEPVIELSEIFAVAEDKTVTYELVEGGAVVGAGSPNDLPILPDIDEPAPTLPEPAASLEGDRLQINPQPETDITDITEIAVRAVSETGESAIHTIELINNNVSEASVESLNTGLEKVQAALDDNPDNLIEILENPELLPVVEEVFTELEDNFGTIYNVLERPDLLEKVGMAPEAAETFNAIIDNPEIGELFGLPSSLQEAFTNEDFSQWDNYLINAQDAASLILPDSPDVPVAFIDFAGDHGEDVTEVFESVNPSNEYETLGIEGNNWAQQLIAYVDNLRDDAGLPTTTDVANTDNPVGAGSATLSNTNPNLPEPALSPTINGDNITGENATGMGAGSQIDTSIGQNLGEPAPTNNTNNPVGAGSATLSNTNPNLPEPALSPTINAGNVRGIVNLSFDLTQIDENGQITTRYQLTPEEQLALQYARDNNILLVVASGNTGDAMSALGQAADEFDNIITVGAVNSTEEVADYSSRGETLTLVAPGGEHKNDPNAFVGTSRATSYVTGAASLVWQANPELSYQQVKEILAQTAQDLGEEGWDTESGAGLLNVTEAVLMAGLIAPEEVVKSEDIDVRRFTGEGRVITQTRAAGEATEQAIEALSDTQNQLLQQWQTLSDLGNPDLTLEDLQKALAEQKTQALERYQQVDTDAAISLAESEQLADALALATRHHQLELGRLQTLQTRQQELNEQLAALKEEREKAVEGNTEQIELLEEAIAQSKEAVKDALAKLQYQLVDPDTLLADPDAVQAEIDKLKGKISQYQQQSAALRATASSFYQQGAQHRQTQQHHTHLAHNSWATTRGFCGRILRKRDTAKYNHHMAIANQAGKNAYSADSQGHILSTNAAKVEQLTAQMNHQTDVLSSYQQLVQNNNQLLSQLTGESQDAHQILKALQEQAEQKTQLAEKYWQQAALAEQRRKQNQDTANHHNNLSRRWEVVGRGGRCGVQPIHGWRHYPEHIAPRDQAQHQANVSENERRVFEQWARQAQTEADNLNKQARALAERVADWPELKQGIQYEINANEQKLQAEEDLLALQTPVQRQQLETLDLQIQQAEEELAKLEGKQLPSQEDKASATETRLTDLQEQSKANREERKTTQKDLQTFLETYGYLLPYPERLQAIKKQIQQLEDEKIRAQELLIQLGNAVTTNPDLVEQFESVQAYISDIDEQLDWAKLQEDQINWSAPQSPQRLALAKLIEELENRRDNVPETNSLPLQEYIDFLREMENRSTSFLNGFDDLQERLDAAQVQQTDTNETLERLQGEYRQLGLEKAAIEEEKLIEKQVELWQEKIDEEQDVLNGYQTQLQDARAVASNWENQRHHHQNSANYWNSRIRTWGIVGHHGKPRRPVYGWIHNPQAEHNRNAAQAAANNAAHQRNLATQNAQELEASLQPSIQESEQNLANLKETQAQFTEIQAINAEADLEDAIALKEQQIADTNTAIRTTQEEIKILEHHLAQAKQDKVGQESSISDKEAQIENIESEIADTASKIADKDAEIGEQKAVLQGYHQQIQDANSVTQNLEHQRQHHQNAANYWNGQINTWGVTGHRWESYRYQSGKEWRTGWRQVPVYGWIHNPQAVVNRDAALAAAQNATQQRDIAAQDAQNLATQLQPEITATEAQIANLETEKQGLEAQKAAQETQLANQEQALETLKTELSEIEDKIADINYDIAANQVKIEDLQAQRQTHEEERDYFQATLDEINQRIADKEVEIADKYREIELTDSYLRQMNTEVERLENRLTVLNEADALESDYQNAADAWQEALENQVKATEELVEIRQQGEQDRQALLGLQSDLAETQTNLAEVTAQQEELQAEVADAQKDLAFTQHQLRTQELQLHSLRAQDAPLRSAESYYYGQAQYHRQNIWYWNGHTYAYHGGHAAAYRHNMQKASRLAEQRNNNWPKIQETEAKIAELKGEIPPKTAEVNTKQAALAEVTPKVTQLTAEVARIEGDMTPIVERLKPLQEAEKAKLGAFQNAVNEATEAADALAETTSEQAEALQRMISFGVLGTESDVDFFATEVEPKVNEFIEQLKARNTQLTVGAGSGSGSSSGQNLGEPALTLSGMIADWEDELNQTTDEVSREALSKLIAETKEQRDRLLTRQNDNNDIIAALTTRLEEATNAIQPLRQQQELEIRQQLETNDERLAALERQLETEEATETALSEDTILAYAQLGDRLHQDLGDAAKVWTEQLLEGHQQTIEIGERQQELSQSVDDLVAYIEENLGEIDGERDRTLANLRDAITTLEVVAPRSDELEQGQTTLTQEIDKLKQWIEQDAQLWEEIAPIAERYGAESEELEAYQQQYQIYKQQDEARAQQYEAQRHQHQMNANHWNSQIRTWGITGYNNSRNFFGKRKRTPVYGWIHNHHAEAQRNASQHAANVAAHQRNLALQLPTANAYRTEFVNNAPNNGTAIDLLQTEAEINSQKYNNQLAQVSAELAQTNAQASAAIAQADWYEKRAAHHWHRSRKNGPTWTEQRKTWKRGKSGKKKEHWVTLTHIDHHWIIWDTYTKYAKQLREQAVRQLVATDNQSQQQERLKPLAEQWASTVNAINAAEPSITASRNLVEQLEASREQIPAAQEALQQLEEILPEVEQQLAQAQKEADAYNAKVLAEWKELEDNDSEYLPIVEDILQQRGELNRKSQELQHQLADVEQWVERQTVALTTETEEVNRLREDLIAQRETLSEQIAQSPSNVDLQTKQAQLQNALGLLDNKATVLQQQQRAFSQKRTLLTAEHEVILAEQRLLDAYLTSPGDLEQLQKQLADARAALAEAQRLAEQAEASSQALTAPLQEVQADLLAQNDEHLRAAKEHQQILRDLLEATELNANYTLQAAQKQREVNDLEFQIQQRLQQMIDAGNKEAEHLLDVAQHNDMATAAEIYYRDYNDIASDTGGSCAGGIARPEDRALANRYYHEMLTHRQLQQRAQAQANHFGHLKRTAQAQKNALQARQDTAAKMLKEINDRIAETQEEREQKQQELAVAQARLDGITRIREQTEQTFITLVNLEQLNLAQAELEQTIATQRQEDIEKAVEERLEREAIELERQRLEARAKLEQLEQLQAEDALLQGVNAVRSEVGLDGVDGDFNPVQVQSQMATLLTQLQDLEQQQPDLPDDLKALLAEVEGDIHQALQGKEAATIQDNLFKVMGGLIGQVQHYKADINRIELEEQWDIALLQTAEQDVQKASKDFLKELQRMEELEGEQQIINPLYLETLNKVALAEQAVDISNELAQQSKEMLEQIIQQRVAERKARKKYFWNSTLGLISQVMTVLSTIVSILSVSFPVLVPFAIGLNLATAGITAIQAVMNGDWLGGIFSVVMAGLNAVTMGMSNTLTAGAKLALQSLQSVAAGAFSSARSIMSGESILGFLQILGSIASVASAGVGGLVKNLSATTQKVMLSVVQSLEKAPQMIYGGIKAIQNGDWLNAISNIFNAVLSVGQSFAGNFNSTLSKVLEVTGNVGNTGLVLAGVIKDGGIEGLLSGLNSILNIWKDDLVGLVDKISGKEECICSDKSEPENENIVSEEDRQELLNDPDFNEIARAIEQDNSLPAGSLEEYVKSMTLEEFSDLMSQVDQELTDPDFVLSLSNHFVESEQSSSPGKEDTIPDEKGNSQETVLRGGVTRVYGQNVNSNSEEGGYYDFLGGYYDEEGGYYDAFGGYYDADGGYYDTNGGYYDTDGGYYDTDGGYYHSDGSYHHPWTNEILKGLAQEVPDKLHNGGVVNNGLFAQKYYTTAFSEEPGAKFSGKTVDDLVSELDTGKIQPKDLPIEYIRKEGRTLILNTRSSAALEKAGIPREQWNVVNKINDPNAQIRLNDQLKRNSLVRKDNAIKWDKVETLTSTQKLREKPKLPKGKPNLKPNSGIKLLGKVGKAGQKVLGPLAIALDAHDLHQAYQADGGNFGENFQQTTGSVLGGWGGGAGGAVFGAQVGGAFGSVVPGVGTAVGAGAGAIIFGVGGALGGSSVGQSTVKWLQQGWKKLTNQNKSKP